MLDSLKPGQPVRCTVKENVRIHDDYETVMRLMRFDPEVRKMLKSAQEYRVRHLLIRSRGKRPWEVREKSARQIRAAKGAQWNMRWIPEMKKDFASVQQYLTIEAK